MTPSAIKTINLSSRLGVIKKRDNRSATQKPTKTYPLLCVAIACQ